MRKGQRNLLVACLLSLAWLTSFTLPMALYQYFHISAPAWLSPWEVNAWSVYFSPLQLVRWAPTISSVDPLVTLSPSFALLFVFWGLVFFAVGSLLTRLRKSPDTLVERGREE